MASCGVQPVWTFLLRPAARRLCRPASAPGGHSRVGSKRTSDRKHVVAAVAMHSPLTRANSVFFHGVSVLATLCFLNWLT